MNETASEAWRCVQLARHPKRPYTLDYIRALSDDFIELHGDRRFRDDRAVVGGLAAIEGRSVVVVGHQKGRNTQENVERNFGMPRPEGFRKAMRLMRLAERLGLPLLTFIDTPGASPDAEAEERGQAMAIADCLATLAGLRTPIVATIIGEGNSGGAIAFALADRLMMLENAYFSVVSPEGCAAILWHDSSHAAEAAAALKLTVGQLLPFGVIDTVIAEPPGGAHEDPAAAAASVKAAIIAALRGFDGTDVAELLERRYERYRRIGVLP